MRTLRAKINWSFLILISCSVLGTVIYLAFLLKSSYLDSLTRRVVKETLLLAGAVDWDLQFKQPAEFYDLERIVEQRLGVIITFFDRQGKPMRELDQIKGFPPLNISEFYQTNKKEISQVQGPYLHVTAQIIRKNQVVGAVRLSQPLAAIDRSLDPLWTSLAGGLIIAYLIAAFASWRIARGVSQPLEEITQVAIDIANRKKYCRVQVAGESEIARLGRAINQMSQSIQNQMETIRRSERRLTSVIETMESGLVMVDSTGQVSLANRSFERLFGVPAIDLIGESYRKLSYPYDLSEMITACAETRTRLQKEIHLYYPHERILEVNLAPMWVETNGVGVVAVFHDLTAIRHLEQLRKDLLANVSHELKTPITSIRGFAETLLDGAMTEAALCEDFLKIIHSESLRLQRLVTDILDLSQIELRGFQLQLEEVEVDEIIHCVIMTMKEQIRRKEQKLELSITPMRIRVDQDRFRQIILNLLSNAVHYTLPGGTITLTVSEQQEQWCIEISDTGIGIPQEDLPRIFERFYRVDKARSRHSGGTGLGLAIVKHLTEEHQGQIEVESRSGKGTTFKLLFPIHEECRVPVTA